MDKLQRMINESNYIVFFGGAGVSTESGIKDFRSEDGLYNEKNDVPPEEILSHGYFQSHTEEFYRYYRAKMLSPGILPNSAHKKLAELERCGKLKAIITQNIDGLHQAAGSKNVYELHGSVKRNYCTKCHRLYTEELICASSGVPHCECGGVIKPDVVLYDEALNESTVQGAVSHIAKADLLIVAGTSLTVYPAAGLLRYFHGKYLALINKDETPVDRLANYVSHEPVGATMSKIAVSAHIENELLKMTISGKDAEAQSLLFKGEEQLWQDEGRLIWEHHSPVVFPICSSLKDDRYRYDGKWYEMQKHGFAFESVFTLSELSENRAVFTLENSDEHRKSYPFEFLFSVEYKLTEGSLATTYSVENRGDRQMPVSFGSHEAYWCKDGIENYEIVFDKDDEINISELENGLVTGKETTISLKNRTLKLERAAFNPDSYVIKGHKSRSVTLMKNDGTRKIKIDFPGIDYLVLWRIDDADYICIEPWCSFIDKADTDGDITKREGILLVSPGEKISKTHTITFEED